MKPVLSDISKRLKIARIASGHRTFKDFSEKHNIPTSTYWQHENGKRALTVENLIHYSELIKVNAGWLLTGHGVPETDIVTQQRIFAALERESYEKELVEMKEKPAPLLTADQRYAIVNLNLFKEVFFSLIPYVKHLDESKLQDVFAYCFDLYNKLIRTEKEDSERKKLIKLCLDSFFSGADVQKESQDVEIAVTSEV